MNRTRSSTNFTYAGLVEKIPYLKDLGITVVELMPIFQRDPQEGDYWGYMPLSFFAPHAQYAGAGDHDEQYVEFRNMVKAFHQANIGVVLDVVYNHTCEGDHRGPIYSYKGIDAPAYYMLSSDPANPCVSTDSASIWRRYSAATRMGHSTGDTLPSSVKLPPIQSWAGCA
jgi:isoamylase